MKSILLSSILIFSCFFVSAQSTWKLKIDKNNIQVYTRNYKDTHKKEFKAITTIKNSSVNTIAEFINTGNKLKNWLYKTSSSKVIDSFPPNTQCVYMVSDLPWPIMNRDHVSKLVTSSPKKNQINIHISSASEKQPKQKHIVRMTDFEGYWLLEQVDANTVKVIHQMYGDLGGNIPTMFVNSQVAKAPFETLSNLKNNFRTK